MWQTLTNSAMMPFTVAAMVLLLLLLIELVGFFFGGVSGFLDNLLPDALVDADFDIDADLDASVDASMDAASSGGELSLGLKALDWLYVGRIPTMILLILLIACFSIAGFIIQELAHRILGSYLSPWLASLDALVVSIPLLKVTAAALYPIIPKEETTAVGGNELLGREARIVLGQASVGLPAQAKVMDAHGQSHYVLLEPDPDYHPQSDSHPSTAATIFTAADVLVLTKQVGERFLARRY